MSTIRKAARADLDAVCRIYDQIHTAEERGEATIGWQRGVYPCLLYTSPSPRD